MLTLRCTRKLLQFLGETPSENDRPATAALGDWYANLVATSGGATLVLFMSERSLLSVVVPPLPTEELFTRFRRRAVGLLRRLGTPAAEVEREAFHLQRIRLGKTRNRRVLGTMNDAAWQLEVLFDTAEGGDPLEAVEDALAEAPFSLVGYRPPAHVARELLSGERSSACPS
jgi:hypothetical protein